MHATYYRPEVSKDLPLTMPKYEETKWKSKKEVDKLNETRGSFRFYRGLYQ